MLGETIKTISEVAKETSKEMAKETKNALKKLDKPLNTSEMIENASFEKASFKSKLKDLDRPLDASEKQKPYQDRVDQHRSVEERAVRHNEISFGSKAAENAAEKLEERRKKERQIKKEEDHLRINEKGISRSTGSKYWTNHYAQEIKSNIRNIEKLEKELSKD